MRISTGKSFKVLYNKRKDAVAKTASLLKISEARNLFIQSILDIDNFVKKSDDLFKIHAMLLANDVFSNFQKILKKINPRNYKIVIEK